MDSGYVQLEFKDDDELIEVVENYALEHDSFDTSFVDSLSDYQSEHGGLTQGQRDALINIIAKFRMPWR